MTNTKIDNSKTLELLELLNIKHKNLTYYTHALSHSSWINEQKNGSHLMSYERLEFLGDAVLGKVVSEYIYRNYHTLKPGEMSILRSSTISKSFLSQVGRRLNLEKYIMTGSGEQNKNISDSIYEDVVESLVGAIFLDLGETMVRKFVLKQIIPFMSVKSGDDLKDYKTKLQELLQAEKRKSVDYVLAEQKRINGEMHFKVYAKFEGQNIGFGEGKSKKVAEQNAAKKAFEKLVVK